MENLVIDTGEIRLSINGDPSRVISFNPKDVVFVERFYQLMSVAEGKAEEYKQRASALEKVTSKGIAGLPENVGARLELMRESCDYMREQIDGVFGEGTSQKAFGDAMNLDMFKQFFDGVQPYFKKVRVEKIAKYTSDASAKRSKRGRK